MNIRNKLNKLIVIVTLIFTIFLFLNIFISSFFYPSNVFYEENNFISIFITFILFTILYFIYKKFIYKKNNISKKYELIILAILFLFLILAELFVLKNLSVNPSWDFGVVFENAESYVLTGIRNKSYYPNYFEYFPNNIMLFVMLVLFIKYGALIGLSALNSAWAMNLLFINLSYIMLYLTLRKKFGNRTSIFGLIISFLFIAPILYSSIFYSDTLSMFVGITFIFLFLSLNYETPFSLKNILIFILFGILLFYGKEIKITSIIPFIAIIFYMIFSSENKKIPLNLIITLGVFIFLSILFKISVVNNSKFDFQESDYGAVPYTHWVMMGVEDIDKDNSGRNSYGGYNINDYNLTLQFDNGKEASKFNVDETLTRIKKMGAMEYYKYLNKKAVNAWTDGLYLVDAKLQLNPRHSNDFIYNELLINKANKDKIIYFSQSMQYLLIMSLIIGAIIKFFRHTDKIDIIRMAIIGIFVFLLIWENRSRYLLNFIPLFVYIICEFFTLLENINLKRQKNFK